MRCGRERRLGAAGSGRRRPGEIRGPTRESGTHRLRLSSKLSRRAQGGSSHFLQQHSPDEFGQAPPAGSGESPDHLNRPPYSIRFPPGPSQDTVRSAAAPHRNSPPEGSSGRQVRTAPRERRQGECGSYRYRRVPPQTAATERDLAAEEASCGNEPATTTARPNAKSFDACLLQICDERPGVDQMVPAMPEIKC